MKKTIFLSEERGKGEYGWLHTRYSFSFSDYYDSTRINFWALRVLNEDIIEPGAGFSMHPHKNMEIVTIVLEGALEHNDSMGNRGVINANEVQRMSAGTGIVHSEYNHSKKEKVHLLQIWIHPDRDGIKPSYEQKNFTKDMMKNCLLPVVSGKKKVEALFINQESEIFISELDKGFSLSYSLLDKNSGAYIFVISGMIKIDESKLSKGDACSATEAGSIEIYPLEKSKILVIDVPHPVS